MPVNFLTADQRASYGRFTGEPSPTELAARYMLLSKDRMLIDRRRSDRARIGYGLQVLALRHLGTFLADPVDVPWALVDHVARQLGIADPTVAKGYGEGTIRFEHQAEITRQYGYRDFNDQPARFRFVRWLFLRSYLAGERPIVLFDHALLHLVESKVLLPGVTTLERLVAEVRERATARLWRQLGSLVDVATIGRLEAMLVVAPGSRRSPPTSTAGRPE